MYDDDEAGTKVPLTRIRPSFVARLRRSDSELKAPTESELGESTTTVTSLASTAAVPDQSPGKQASKQVNRHVRGISHKAVQPALKRKAVTAGAGRCSRAWQDERTGWEVCLRGSVELQSQGAIGRHTYMQQISVGSCCAVLLKDDGLFLIFDPKRVVHNHCSSTRGASSGKTGLSRCTSKSMSCGLGSDACMKLVESSPWISQRARIKAAPITFSKA